MFENTACDGYEPLRRGHLVIHGTANRPLIVWSHDNVYASCILMGYTGPRFGTPLRQFRKVDLIRVGRATAEQIATARAAVSALAEGRFGRTEKPNVEETDTRLHTMTQNGKGFWSAGTTGEGSFWVRGR